MVSLKNKHFICGPRRYAPSLTYKKCHFTEALICADVNR